MQQNLQHSIQKPQNTTLTSPRSRRTLRSMPSPLSSHHQRSQPSSRDQLLQLCLSLPPTTYNTGAPPNKETGPKIQEVPLINHQCMSTSQVTTGLEVGVTGPSPDLSWEAETQQVMPSNTPSVRSESQLLELQQMDLPIPEVS